MANEVNREKPSVYAVDFFSGCGGTSEGLKEAKINIVGAIDNDPDAARSYQKNFPEVEFFEEDVANVSVDDIRRLLPHGSLSLLAACAPCQPFSAQQKYSDASDPRRELLLRFLTFVEDILPDFILVENVPGLQKISVDKGPLPVFLETIEALGYDYAIDVVRASDYGVPQVRRRLVLIASRGVPARLPSATHGKEKVPYSTVREWISNLAPIAAGEQDPSDAEHVAARLSELNLQRIKATPEGGNRKDWPEDLWANCHKNYTGHSDAYGRLYWDRPASGLTTRCISYSNGRFGHPSQDRALSIREAALLQTFRPDYQFFGTITSKARQIGNAVPPLMAKALGEKIVELAIETSHELSLPSSSE